MTATSKAPDTLSAAIFGCAGAVLGPEERGFFAEARPWGFILFARNVETPEQLRGLTADLREAAGWNAPILIDQEGGRVARLRGPFWREWDPVGAWCAAAESGRIAEETLLEALRLRYALIAAELAAVGVDVDCAPLLDLRLPEAHGVIGDRALGADPAAIGPRARAVAEGLREGGALPVIKHLPGHGRAMVDSHLALPRVDAPLETLRAEDFAACAALADEALGMTAHVIYEAIDGARPATVSPAAIGQAVREEIGFDGLLMTDDLSMKALEGDFETRARDSLAAGCDLILHCNGDMAEMTAVMRGVGALADEASRRSDRALREREEIAARAARFDAAAAEARLAELLQDVPGAERVAAWRRSGAA